jgi:arginine-tRNA-protein transferase
VNLIVESQKPTQEKFDLYRRYQLQWHGKDDATFKEFTEFLYDSPVDTLDFEYRDVAGKLLAVGVCDRARESLSSVYFYFDPSESKRGLGTLGALREIQWAASNSIAYYYLGYWVESCGAMNYKASFDPHEILCSDGVWRKHEKQS